MSSLDPSRLFRAFGDPLRLRILHLLRSGEVCVGDLVEALRAPQPTVSRQLAVLREAGLIAARRDGRWSFYALAETDHPLQRRLLGCVASCFDEVPELREDERRLADLLADGGCCAKSTTPPTDPPRRRTAAGSPR